MATRTPLSFECKNNRLCNSISSASSYFPPQQPPISLDLNAQYPALDPSQSLLNPILAGESGAGTMMAMVCFLA